MLVAGKSLAREAATVSRSAWAVSSDTPWFNRVSAASHRLPRFWSVDGEVVSEIIAVGTHTSVSNDSPENPGAMTPTIVTARSLS